MTHLHVNHKDMKSPFAVEFRHVTKTFGSIKANNDISFKVPKGTVHALVGENGAGKSTAMKILFGLYKEDSGEILVHGKPQHWDSPKDAIKNGIGMVHQHFMLAENLNGLDNIILGDEECTLKLPFIPLPFNVIDRKKAREKISIISEKYGLSVPLNLPISQLTVGMQQRIEILKLLYRDADILILDEPTAVLTPPEVDELFANLKKLKDEGKTILIVTHKLREVLTFTDEITVFRGGSVVGHLMTSDASEQKIASLMVGRKVELRPEVSSPQHLGKHVLSVDNVTIKNLSHKKQANQKNALNKINLSVRAGEIVGIAGVEGNGQSVLLDLIFHPQKYFGPKCSSDSIGSGKVTLLENDVTHKSSAQMSKLVVGFVPEDRHLNGLLLQMSVEENYILGRHKEKKFRRAFFFQNRVQIRKSANFAMEKYDIRPRLVKAFIHGFSGGNQQKLIIARELAKKPNFIVAANPTRGVDIGAIEFIHNKLIGKRDKGAGILLVSSELDEILKLSDRILVFYGGEIVAEYKRHGVDEHTLGLAMCGGCVK